MKKSFLWPVLGAVFCTQTYFQCGEECFTPDAPVQLTQTEVTNLDNRAAEPIILAPGAAGFLSAYGFRLAMHTVLPNPTDTTDTSCPFGFVFDPSFTGCEIYTLTGLGTNYPSGSAVSDVFRWVDRRYQTPTYYAIPDAAQPLSIRRTFSETYNADFLLVEPPATAGWQQFQIRLTRSDSTTLLLTTDSIYLQ